jgi:hypothetical protein
MIGRGRNRGPFVRDCNGASGWEFADRADTMRWGTNEVARASFVLNTGPTTQCFAIRFESGLPTPHESQAASADSGGAVFIKSGEQWELAGIMLATTRCESDRNVAIYGAFTFIADLSFYRDRILGSISLSGAPRFGISEP